MPVQKPKVVVKVPETPQEASDLAREFKNIRETKNDIEKVEKAQREALLGYYKAHPQLKDDDQGITFEEGNGVIALTYRLEGKEVYVVKNLDADTILWAAEHNILGATKAALEPHKLTPEYARFQQVLEPATGSEKLEFVAVQG